MWVRVKPNQPQGHWHEGVERQPGEVFLLDLPEGEDEVPADLADRLEEVSPPPMDPDDDQGGPELTLVSLADEVRDIQSHRRGPLPRGLVHFAGVAEPGISVSLSVTIALDPDGEEDPPLADIVQTTAYTEADTANAPAGVWTNGSTAAQSAASFAAAVNQDARRDPDPDDDPDPTTFVCPIKALVLANGVTVLLFYCRSTCAESSWADFSPGEVDVTTTSPANVLVEETCDGDLEDYGRTCLYTHEVTPLDVAAQQIVMPLSCTLGRFALLPWMAASGALLSPVPTGTLVSEGDWGAAGPCRLSYMFGGGVNPGVGAKMSVLAHGRDD